MHDLDDYALRFERIENRYASFAAAVARIVGDLQPGQAGIRRLTEPREDLQQFMQTELPTIADMIAEDRAEVDELLRQPENLADDLDATDLLYRQNALTRELDGARDAHSTWRAKIGDAIDREDRVAIRVLVDLYPSVSSGIGIHSSIYDSNLLQQAKRLIAAGATGEGLTHQELLDETVAPAASRVRQNWRYREYYVLVDEGDDRMAGSFLLEPTGPTMIPGIVRRPTGMEMRTKVEDLYGKPRTHGPRLS